MMHKKEYLGNKSSHHRIEQYLKNKFQFRYNEVNGKVEFKRKSKRQYKVLDDYELNTIYRELSLQELSCSITRLRTLINSDFSKKYDPFKQYFKGLPAYNPSDGDYIQLLASTVKTTNDELWQMCFQKWIVALVASLLVDEIINHTVIVLSGEQGVGKTSFILSLLPPLLKDYSYSGTINPDNKDTLIHLSQCAVINLDELENLNKTEQGAIKEIITKPNILLRKPYGYTSENFVRRASFAGSVNNKEFLSDTTGSRRFLPFEVLSIDKDADKNIDKVYAQAKYLFETGFRYWFDKDDISILERNNENYRIQSVEEEMLHKYFESCEIEDATQFLTTTDVLLYLQQKDHITINEAAKKKMGSALRQHKFLRVKKRDRYVYALKEKSLLSTQPEGFDINSSFSGWHLS